MPALPPAEIPLPKSWTRHVRSAMLHVIALAQYAVVYTRSWAASSPNARVRLQADKDRLQQEVALVAEELRIKDARMRRIPAHQRPHFPPPERLAILELAAARSWSNAQTARVFQLSAATIASWKKRLTEHGEEALVRILEPVNRFPDFVRYAVQRLKALCPQLGKVKIAQFLARAGLHLAPTTVGRMIQESPRKPAPAAEKSTGERRVTATRPNHVWHVDLTTVPLGSGFWTSWIPGALPQCWPFCWWVAVVMDHYSRRVMGLAVFSGVPTSAAICVCLGRAIRTADSTPKYIICDQGAQFDCQGFTAWCGRHDITPRYGALGQHGSIAVIERFIKTLKTEGTRRFLVPLLRNPLRRELQLFLGWYNAHRPHMTLRGQTPDEVYFSKSPANRSPRCEPRPQWPRASRCAAPQTLVAGQPGAKFNLEVQFVIGRRHLPVLKLNRAA